MPSTAIIRREARGSAIAHNKFMVFLTGNPQTPDPGFLSAALLAQGVLLFRLGAALYLVPQSAERAVAVAADPTDGRGRGAWLVAFGLSAVLASRANDLGRLEISAWSYGLMAVLELVVVIRHMDLIR